MKYIALLFPFLLMNFPGLCQSKPVVDTGMLNTWPMISSGENSVAISPDGRYTAFIVYNHPIGKSTLTIKELEGKWEKSIIALNPSIVFFSTDSKQLIYRTEAGIWRHRMGEPTGKLSAGPVEVSHPYELKGRWIIVPNEQKTASFKLIDLSNNKEQTLDNIAHFEWMNAGKKLLLTSTANDLTLLELSSNTKLTIPSVASYAFSPSLQEIAFTSTQDSLPVLKRLQLNDGKEKTTWRGKSADRIEQLIFDEQGKQLAFVVMSNNNKSIWHCPSWEIAATQLISDAGLMQQQNMRIGALSYFSPQGSNWLFFAAAPPTAAALPAESTITSVDIWNYQDDILFPGQQDNRLIAASRELAIEPNSRQLYSMKEKEHCIQAFKDYALIEVSEKQTGSNRFQQKASAYWLYNLKTGSKILIKDNNPRSGIRISASPNGRWIIYWDQATEDYYSFDPQTGKTVNLTANLPFKFTDEIVQNVSPIPVGYVHWEENDDALLIYDNYDLWRLDPNGSQPPFCLTGEYGRTHGIYLRLMQDFPKNSNRGTAVLFTGFNKWTKQDGIFSLQWGNPKSLTPLVVGPYNYYQNTIYLQPFNHPMAPLSGGQGKTRRWIVLRQSDTAYPNLFYSKDLQHFEPITNLQPHKSVNWLSAEPVIWKMYNGQLNTGVLYKPENFDSSKKYPVIFNYYEKFSQRCYQFPMPDLTTENINIPWFVSRGYLVFTPDIQYSTASVPGGMTITEAAYNTVASAAEFLSQRPYVDKKHMAIQGHSFGAYQTLGILCNSSNLFAAGVEVAGTMDNISSYLTLVTADESPNAPLKVDKQDHPQGRMGATPWERPDLYIRSSSVLNANKINTPLLMVHNKKDGSINFDQAIEMYMALRRLSKPCWLIQYDKSGHVVSDPQDKLDYTLRLTQYFDHYLKDAPAPLWMTMTHLRQYKDKNNLFALDSTRSCYPGCKACEKNAKPSPTY